MPKVRGTTYLSPAQTNILGQTLRFTNFVPQFGPNGLRNVVDKIEVVFELTDLNNAAAAVEGEDVWRLIGRAVVVQADGIERINLLGDQLRVFCYDAMGADRVPEYADIAIANDQALTYSFPIPFERRYAKRPNDYTLPADVLREVRITTGTAAELSVGGTVTVDTPGTVRLLAHCHEEKAVEFKMVDQVYAQTMNSTAGMTLKVGGRLHWLALHKRAASGGTAWTTNFTNIRIDGLITEGMVRNPDLLQQYAQARGAAANDPGTDGGLVHNDPFVAGRAIPVLFADEDTSPFDGPVFDELVVRTSMSEASTDALVRVVLPQSDRLNGAIASKYGVPPGELRAKTLSKGQEARSRLAGSAWLPKSARLRARGLAQ